MNKFPSHIGIIMDGNRRWADEKNMPHEFGHAAGVKAFKKIVNHCENIGLKYLTVYAFSIENWQRSTKEVNILMELFKKYLEDSLLNSGDSSLKVNFIGELFSLPSNLLKLIHKMEDKSKNNKGMMLNVAMSYSSRNEILCAAKRISEDIFDGKLNPKDISEDIFSNYLYTAHQPEPDLIIRTGGESRISNFLLWQAAYSELWFTDIFWPDFKPENLDEAISDFQKENADSENLNYDK